MSKVCIVGDCHFDSHLKASRKDNYPETLLNKLDSLLELCKNNVVTDVIFLGDLIESNRIDLPYLITLYNDFLILRIMILNHFLNHYQ